MPRNRVVLRKSAYTWLAIFAFGWAATQAIAQAQSVDSLPETRLEPVIIRPLGDLPDLQRLPSVDNGFLNAGHKTERVRLGEVETNLAEKTGRQVFAKVPGVMVYDMDGAGNQVNISMRGLDPHRGWEINQRLEGFTTNSDLYGYPASHFSVPFEAIETIDLVRGSAALQYGSQFGGLLNYRLKRPDANRKFTFESINSVGSFGLASTYNAISSRQGNLSYSAYVCRRSAQGYRHNSRSDYAAQGVNLWYRAGQRLELSLSWNHSTYLHQLPGPLTDDQFRANPRTATRARNYYSPDIHVPGFSARWKASSRTTISWTVSGLLGLRKSVLFDRPATVADTVNTTTGNYNRRQVDIDRFNSWSSELRLLHQYPLLGDTSTLVAGVAGINNLMHRNQQGIGTVGFDYDLSLAVPGWGRELSLKSTNLAVFIENRFAWRRLGLTPGFRIETGSSEISGQIVNYPTSALPRGLNRRFALGGLRFDVKPNAWSEIYGGWTQNYRPVIFKDWIPTSVFEKVDDALQDAYGHNLDAGWRGHRARLHWDVSVFRLVYRNRIGTIVQAPDTEDFSLLRTNIGSSLTQGLELFAEVEAWKWQSLHLNAFASYAWMDARYIAGQLRGAESQNINLEGKQLEGVPRHILRSGLTLKLSRGTLALLYSYVSESYADALNTRAANATGSVGLVSAYGLFDLNASWHVSQRLVIRLTINNALNQQYFTKRPTFYPGPGIWPSDGRSWALSLGLKI